MRTPLHVMHVALSLSPGGAERLVIDLGRRLRPDVRATVCCLDDRGAWADQATAAGIDVIALRRQPGFRPALGLEIARLARRVGARVLHCHQYSPFVYATLAGLRSPGLRIVFTEHGRLSDAPPSRKRTAANRLLAWRPDVIAAVSHELRAHMAAEGFPASRVRVIHNGIDAGASPTPADRAAARRALGLDDGSFVIGTVARFDPVKRLDVLVDAFAPVRQAIPGARLVLVGGGDETPRLRDRAAAAGLAADVIFTGVRDDARALLPAFDVYANTSASEGVSLTLLEAMATSLPIVATRVGGTPEVVVDGVSGHLVAAGNAAGVAAAMVGLARDPDARERMGAAGRARVVERFSLDRMARQYLAAYEGRREDR